MEYFQFINESNKLTLNKPVDSDVVYYSELYEWYTQNAFRSFSLKYVLENCIRYKVGNREFIVEPGNFMLACKQPGVNAYFDSPFLVKSICIDVCPATVAEAFAVLTRSGDFDNYLAGYFKSPDFFESVNLVKTTILRQKLEVLAESIRKNEVKQQVNKEWFLDLVEKIIFHEYRNYHALNSLAAIKTETRKEIYRRLLIAVEYINENFLQVEDIAEIAMTCNMSVFHFFRSFRQAYKITPYHFILKKRLDHAKLLLGNREHSVSAVAAICHFADIFSFSKAFKKEFGLSPSQYRSGFIN